jgi:hypothetical protein
MIMRVSILIGLHDVVEVDVEPRGAQQTIAFEMNNTFLGNNLFDQEKVADNFPHIEDWP